MVDVSIEESIRRFPWTYSKVTDKDGNFVGFRVRFDFIVVSRPDDPFLFDMYHFTSLSDRLDNAQLAKECGLDVDFGHTYIICTPCTHSNIYKQIFEYDNILCALHPSI